MHVHIIPPISSTALNKYLSSHSLWISFHTNPFSLWTLVKDRSVSYTSQLQQIKLCLPFPPPIYRLYEHMTSWNTDRNIWQANTIICCTPKSLAIKWIKSVACVINLLLSSIWILINETTVVKEAKQKVNTKAHPWPLNINHQWSASKLSENEWATNSPKHKIVTNHNKIVLELNFAHLN